MEKFNGKKPESAIDIPSVTDLQNMGKGAERFVVRLGLITLLSVAAVTGYPLYKNGDLKRVPEAIISALTPKIEPGPIKINPQTKIPAVPTPSKGFTPEESQRPMVKISTPEPVRRSWIQTAGDKAEKYLPESWDK